MEGYTESLRHELAEFGINVILIEPGAIGSNFMNNIKTAKDYNPNNSPYAKTIQKTFEGIQPIMANSTHPREVARVILNVANSSSPNVRYSVGKMQKRYQKRGRNYLTKRWNSGHAKVHGKERIHALMNVEQ